MPKVSKPGYYAVRVGRVPGIYHSWSECEAQVKGFTGATYKKLSTEAEAREFMAAGRPSTMRTFTLRDAAPVASTSRTAPNPEPTLYSTSVEAPRTTDADELGFDVVYCDGACKGNGQIGSIAGIGVWWGDGDPRNISERCPGDQTNNRAELIAIVRILETAPQLERPLLIKSDSKYSIQCVTSWISNWMQNGFHSADGKPVKNRTLIKYLSALLHVRRKTSQTVKFKHVRGHVGIRGNEAADRLANFGATKSEVPERDWRKLEKELLQSFKPVQPPRLADNGLQGYADALFNDDDVAELTDTSISKQRSSASRTHASAPLAPPQVPPLPAKVTRFTPASSNVEAPGVLSRPRLPPESFTTSGPAGASNFQSLPSRKPVLPISKEEIAYASCLLSDREMSTLGKDGVFDSDF